jgi:voltage-gated potassium channel Kch
MRRVRTAWRDLQVVVRAVSGNLALFAGLITGAALLMRLAGAYPGENLLDLIVRAFHMAYLEAVVEPGDGWVPEVLTFVVPVLGVLILGEGALRVFAVYLRRDEHREEWDRLVAKTFSRHTIICGVGELGRAMCRRLLALNPDTPIVLVDTKPDVLSELGVRSPNVCHLQADMTSLATLEAANCREAALVILASGNDALNLEAGYKAHSLNPQAEIWIRLYRSELASLMDLATKPTIHFFSPYERAADALVEHLRNLAH